jgi:oligopeptide/dipeptide ABC transporter ATP-binding protein
MSLLIVDSLGVRYGDDVAVDSVSFSVNAGDSVGLVGESGSGKTQTALSILGLLPRNATVRGSIVFDGTELQGASEKQLDNIRAQRISMVFQDPTLALNPYLKIGEQILRVLVAHGMNDKHAAAERVLEMLSAVGLPDPERQSGAYPHQLSGGMRQRAMIASALITEPDLLIADEPTTALDVTVQAQILDLLDAIRKDTALLLITHDLGIVAGHCERMLVFERGRLIESGQTRDVFRAPQQQHTKAMLAAAPRLSRSALPPSSSEEVLVDVDGAAVSYAEPGHGLLHAVRDVDLQLKRGETLAIVGESGSGKSSLVRAILGLIPTRAGTVSFCGRKLPPDARKRAAKTRRDLQLVFQDPIGSLNPQMRVINIIREPLLVHEKTLGRSEGTQRVGMMMQEVGLGEEFLERFPHELSGGQAQRVAIARALILKPQVLVCDEAVAALDGSVREQIIGLLRKIQEASGLSILFISHDLGVVRSIGHRVLVMYLGRLVELSSNTELFDRPLHPYTRALLDAVPVPDPEGEPRTASLAGEVPSILTPPSGCAFHPRCQYAESQCENTLPEKRVLVGTTVACHRAGELNL